MKPFHVYILRCGDGTYYTGHTDDLAVRMTQHHEGKIGYTATRKPVELIWAGEFETREGALAFELQIKGWSRAKKEALMAGDWERIQALAASHGGLRQAQPEQNSAVPPEPVEGPVPRLRQAQPERNSAVPPEPVEGLAPRLRQAQPEREVSVRPEPVEGVTQGLPQAQPEREVSVRPEPVEGLAQGLRQAQPERGGAQGGQGGAQGGRGLLEGVLQGNRRALAKAITLLESTRADHRSQADELLTALLPHTGNSFRLGISGVPGVGKSTFIEALGLHLIAHGHRVAVLTIDPSSTVSGGSILGDKTRMEQLSVHEKAFIRPSPSSGTLGGVAEKTREAMLVCEAAGYDIVIVETVGVGQSETAVAGMTDMFVLMQLPNAGDDLQAIKKGVMELADLVVINKADIDPDAATRAQAQITSALRLFTQHGRGALRPGSGQASTGSAGTQVWQPQVMQLSALKVQGIDAFWQAVAQFRQQRATGGQLQARRQHQALAWMWERIESGLKQAFKGHPRVKALMPEVIRGVEQARMPASTAARQLLGAMETFTVRAEPVQAHANDTASPSTGSGPPEA